MPYPPRGPAALLLCLLVLAGPAIACNDFVSCCTDVCDPQKLPTPQSPAAHDWMKAAGDVIGGMMNAAGSFSPAGGPFSIPSALGKLGLGLFNGFQEKDGAAWERYNIDQDLKMVQDYLACKIDAAVSKIIINEAQQATQALLDAYNTVVNSVTAELQILCPTLTCLNYTAVPPHQRNAYACNDCVRDMGTDDEHCSGKTWRPHNPPPCSVDNQPGVCDIGPQNEPNHCWSEKITPSIATANLGMLYNNLATGLGGLPQKLDDVADTRALLAYTRAALLKLSLMQQIILLGGPSPISNDGMRIFAGQAATYLSTRIDAMLNRTTLRAVAEKYSDGNSQQLPTLVKIIDWSSKKAVSDYTKLDDQLYDLQTRTGYCDHGASCARHSACSYHYHYDLNSMALISYQRPMLRCSDLKAPLNPHDGETGGCTPHPGACHIQVPSGSGRLKCQAPMNDKDCGDAWAGCRAALLGDACKKALLIQQDCDLESTVDEALPVMRAALADAINVTWLLGNFSHNGLPQASWGWFGNPSADKYYPFNSCLVGRNHTPSNSCTPIIPGPSMPPSGLADPDAWQSTLGNVATCGGRTPIHRPHPIDGRSWVCADCATARLNCPKNACTARGCSRCREGEYLAVAGRSNAVTLRSGWHYKSFDTCRPCSAPRPVGFGPNCLACTASQCTRCRRGTAFDVDTYTCKTVCRVDHCATCYSNAPWRCSVCSSGYDKNYQSTRCELRRRRYGGH